MKYVLAIIMSVFLAIAGQPQDMIEKSIPVNNKAKVELDFRFADQIIIKTWDKNEVRVKAIVNINDNSDNDKFSLEADGGGDAVSFESKIEDMEKLSGKNNQYMPGVIVREDDHCVHLEIDFEVFLPAGAQIELETISGNVEITGLEAPMDIKTISGFIDISISENANADITMETITGDFYSNLDLMIEKEPHWKHHFVGGKLIAKLNEGGEKIHLKTISGNIFLRRK